MKKTLNLSDLKVNSFTIKPAQNHQLKGGDRFDTEQPCVRPDNQVTGPFWGC